MELFREDGCMTDAGFRAMMDGQLDELGRLEAAEHLSYCDQCMDRYTALLTADALETPPRSVQGAVMGTIWARLMQNTYGRAAVAGVAAVLALTLWRSGALQQIIQYGAGRETVLETDQSQLWEPGQNDPAPENTPQYRPIGDDRPQAAPEQLGRPVETKQDRRYAGEGSSLLHKLLTDVTDKIAGTPRIQRNEGTIMKKNGILTLLFAFIPGAGQMYQGYMKRGLSLVLMAAAIGMAAMLIPPIAFALLVVLMYSFFDTFNLRAQISMGTAPEDDYLVHFDPQDKRLARMMMDSHRLVGWCLIATGALIAYEQIIMNTLGDILWRWGQKAPVWRAIYLVMDQLPEVVLCVALILCGIWLVRGPRAKKAAPEAAPEETDFQEYQPEKKMPSLLDHFARKAEPDATGEVTFDPEDEDDGREE